MRVLAGVALSSLLVVGCSGGGSGSPPPVSPATGSIRIVNGASYDIDETYVTPVSSSSWGSIQNASAIPPTYSITISDLTPGPWNGLAVSNGSMSTYYAHAANLDVVAGQTVEFYPVDADFSGSLDVTNGSADAILAVYVKPTSSATWGSDQLSGTLAYAETLPLTDIPPGTYDVDCEYASGGYMVADNVIASFAVTSVTCY